MALRQGCVPAGNVLEARYASHAPKFIKPTKQNRTRRAGVLYEEKAQGYVLRCVAETHSEHLTIQRSPWLAFRSEGDREDQVRFCQPDCLIFDSWERKLTIIEIKLQHCSEAFDQVRKLYEPVLKIMFPNHLIAALELVQWHDPHVVFPETYYLEPNILLSQANRFGIHIWNPRYDKSYKTALSTRYPVSENPPAE